MRCNKSSPCYDRTQTRRSRNEHDRIVRLLACLLACLLVWRRTGANRGMIRQVAVLLLVAAANPTVSTPLPDPVVIPVANTSTHGPFVNSTEFVYTAQRPFRNAYWIHTDHSTWKVITPPPFSSVAGETHRSPLWKTSKQANYFGCDILAVNGGPFHSDGTSCGPLVVEGNLIAGGSNMDSNWIGIGKTNQNEWILGAYHQFIGLDHIIESFVTGFHWLVYNGTMVAKDSDDPSPGATTGNTGGSGNKNNNGKPKVQRAARTAVGVVDDGSLVILVVDGCEKWYEERILAPCFFSFMLISDLFFLFCTLFRSHGLYTLLLGY